MKAKFVEDRKLPAIVTNERDDFGEDYQSERVMALNEARRLYLELGEAITRAEKAAGSAQKVHEPNGLKDYAVVWEFDALASSPLHAARIAWEAARARGSIANVFDIYDEEGNHTRIDLQEHTERQASNEA